MGFMGKVQKNKANSSGRQEIAVATSLRDQRRVRAIGWQIQAAPDALAGAVQAQRRRPRDKLLLRQICIVHRAVHRYRTLPEWPSAIPPLATGKRPIPVQPRKIGAILC